MKRSCSASVERETRDSDLRRFVILWHRVPPDYGRPSHFDLMFEQDGGLRTWAVQKLPDEDGRVVRAQALPLHRLAYLEYEGEVSCGRGSVSRIARGVYETVADRPRRVILDLQASAYRGRLVFQCPASPDIGGSPQLFVAAEWDAWLESRSSRGMGNSEAS